MLDKYHNNKAACSCSCSTVAAYTEMDTTHPKQKTISLVDLVIKRSFKQSEENRQLLETYCKVQECTEKCVVVAEPIRVYCNGYAHVSESKTNLHCNLLFLKVSNNPNTLQHNITPLFEGVFLDTLRQCT